MPLSTEAVIAIVTAVLAVPPVLVIVLRCTMYVRATGHNRDGLRIIFQLPSPGSASSSDLPSSETDAIERGQAYALQLQFSPANA
ncbi:hypothetical protein IF1G_02287 [Cordyceps javanica]|uniref:Uncharacterized protein n=1 Tax=Cordyceps javanica TaxID=43265 RepID=A0A545W646_9HYPO|nr:hypothetical protein IF1G_02287 [Cordyceps javanica]TQW09422.1 hypothetical protein IF2G_02212 [Cordyceps javanica]